MARAEELEVVDDLKEAVFSGPYRAAAHQP